LLFKTQIIYVYYLIKLAKNINLLAHNAKGTLLLLKKATTD